MVDSGVTITYLTINVLSSYRRRGLKFTWFLSSFMYALCQNYDIVSFIAAFVNKQNVNGPGHVTSVFFQTNNAICPSFGTET